MSMKSPQTRQDDNNFHHEGGKKELGLGWGWGWGLGGKYKQAAAGVCYCWTTEPEVGVTEVPEASLSLL